MADSADPQIESDVAGTVDDDTGREDDAAQCSRYADIAVELGYCERERADEALRAFLDSGENAQEFGACLVEEGIISREQARACERALRGRSTIGGFAILEKVGQGGMGTVFRARQISMDRIVAVKILAPKFAQDPSFKQRFLNEARTCAKLSHLNIINGIDCGEDSGYTYFAMEFVEGRTVKQVLKEKERFEPDEAFAVVRQICDALSYARKFGMVHRDIKPDNIMLTPANVAKLCDLGLAMQAEQGEQNEAVPATETVQNADGTTTEKKPEKRKCLALGTPHYMSPEQARGQQNIDARSDIYSLGATFYHLIAGQTMFEGNTSTEVMTHHVVNEAPNPCVIDPDIPPGIGMVISKMTAKDPADRYADADALIADLEALKNGAMPSAASFSAKSSCAILPPNELSRYRAGGSPRWVRMIPHIAAALLLGVLAYFIAISFGNKPQVVAIGTGTTLGGAVAVATPSTHPIPTPAVEPPVTHLPPTETKPAVINKPTETVKVANPGKTPDPPLPGTEKKNDPPKNIEPEKNVDPPVVVAPPPPEVARPELKLTPDILYARFLQEYENRAGKMEPAKLFAEMLALSTAPAYKDAREDIAAELADLKGAVDFENKALKKIAEQKTKVDLCPEMIKKWGYPQGEVVEFDETRGLSIKLESGLTLAKLSASALSIDAILSKSADGAPLSKLRYEYARGNRPGVNLLMPLLPPAEIKRWDRKFELLKLKELELTAREAYKNLAFVAEAKSWKTFEEMVVPFMTDYGTTAAAKQNLTQIHQWQDTAMHALEPPSKWRKFFHAATVRDIPDARGEPQFVELVYDFKTPDQSADFLCMHGQLKVENGRMIVPPGGGEFAHVMFIAPFESIQSFKAQGKSLHSELRPMGVVFIDPGQAMAGPNPGNPMLRLDPDTKTATMENMAEHRFTAAGPAPTFNWLQDVTIAFKSVQQDKQWSVDDKIVSEGKWPKQFNGGWIALWGSQGNQSWGAIRIIMRPEKDWKPTPSKKKADAPN